MNRYQKITAMEPEELAEFLASEESLFKSCNKDDCPGFGEDGKCADNSNCAKAMLNWILREIEECEESSESVKDAKPYENREDTEIKSREDILRAAIRCVCTDRNEQYGEPEDSFSCIAEYWQKYLIDRCGEFGADVCIPAEDVAVMMMLFKIARYITADTPIVDTFVDIAGYAACAGEICERHRRQRKTKDEA